MNRVFLALLLLTPSLAVAQPTPPPAKTQDSEEPDLDGANRTITTAVNQITNDRRDIKENEGNRDDKSVKIVAQAQQDIPKQINAIVAVGDGHPQSPKINIMAGQALIGVDEPRRSLPLIDRAVDLSREKQDTKTLGAALFLRATANVRLKDYSSVTRDARSILEFDPNNQQAQMLLSLYSGRVATHGGGDIDQKPAPNQPLGMALINSGGSAQSSAVQLTAPGMQTAGQIEAARLIKLAAEKAKLDASSAKSLLTQALTVDPQNVAALIARARLAKEAGDHNAVIADASAAASISPKIAEIYVLRAEAKKALGYSAQEVASDYATARELDPTLTPAELNALSAGKGQASQLALDGAAARAKRTASSDSLVDKVFSFLPEERRPLAAKGSLGLLAALAALILLTRKRQST